MEKKYGQVHKKDLSERKKAFEVSFKEDLEKVREQFEGSEEEKEILEQKLKVIVVQTECMMNTRDDLNVGFMELWQEEVKKMEK